MRAAASVAIVTTWFESADDATARLRAVGYLTDDATALTAYLAGALEKPLLVEGPAGVGKTELAKAVARAAGAELVRLQCYEGLDEARALYEWNYKKQLLRIQASGGDSTWNETHDDIFTEEFLLTRPLLSAIRRDEPTVLLIDEVDKTDVEVEGLLLEVLSDFQVTIPELGTVTATRRPFVVLTSNASRELSEAVKRRCLFLHLDYPDAERERAIVTSQVPGPRREGRRAARRRRRTPARARAQEGAVDRGVGRLGAHADRPADRRPRRGHRRPHPRRRAQARLGPGARDEGAEAPSMSLLDTHIGFVEALRSAGLSVSLAEGLDAISALEKVRWHDRETVRAAYAATLVKRQPQRVTFDAVFDIYYPRLIGGGVAGEAAEQSTEGPQDTGPELARFREALAEALASGDQQALQDLAVEAVARFGAMPGRGPGLSSWSAYTSLQRVSPAELMDRLVQGLLAGGLDDERAQRTAGRRIGDFTRLVEGDARRRIAEEKGPEHVVDVTVRPTIDRLDFTAARRSDLEEMRREIYPLARRLAARLTKEQHALRRGPLDVRRTVRASIATGGVPLTTHHRPRRPHRTDLVVLCDVSGSVANFAQFTLMLVYALREAFSGVRAFTFVDDVVEVSDTFRPGADVVEVMESLSASISQAALWGRTNYGRALTRFAEEHADAIGPRSSLLVLGDARSNYSDLALPVLADLAGRARHSWWLNPEHPRHWGTGDSAAEQYGQVVPMVECRNLAQLGEFVHEIV